MRVAVISDIHGNAIALDAVLADLRGESIDQMVCLGDAIQSGPQPAQVVARLRELACPVVMGNADDWLLKGDEPDGEEVSSERLIRLNAVRDWSLTQLSTEDRAFIAQFQPTVTIDLGTGYHLLCFHGSPTSFHEVILPTTSVEEAQKYLGDYADHILTGGHTHMQQIRRVGERFFFNPGSIGFACNQFQPEDDFRYDHWADYAILNVKNGDVRLEFRRVPFNVAELIRLYQTSGRPYADELIALYQPR